MRAEPRDTSGFRVPRHRLAEFETQGAPLCCLQASTRSHSVREERKRCDNDRAAKRKKTESRVQKIDGGEIRRHPHQIKQRRRSGAGEKRANLIEVADRD